MALAFVGSASGVWVGSTSTTNTVSLTALTGGIASAAAAGDIVVAVYATGSTVDRTLSITDGTTAYTLVGTELYSNGTSFDTNLRVAYKVLTAADASVSFGPTGSTADGGAAEVHVWRGVDLTTPLDVTATTATGTGTGRPNPPAITPVTANAVVLVAGGAAALTGAVFVGTGLSNFGSENSPDTNDGMVGLGSFAWVSGLYDPAAWTGGTTNAGDSWAAVTLALRPGPIAVAVTETATGTDTASSRGSFPRSLSESATGTDTASSLGSFARAASESATGTDTTASLGSFVRTASETATGTETVVAVPSTPVQVSETASGSDTAAAVGQLRGDVDESASGTDALDIAQAYEVSVFETASIIVPSTWGEGGWGSGTWGYAPGDLVQAGLSADRSVQESASGADGVSSEIPVLCAVFESASLADAVSAGRVLYPSLQELAYAHDIILGRLRWELIDDTQEANWQNAPTSQTATWQDVNTPQSAGWQNIANAQGGGWQDADTDQTANWQPISTE